MTRQPASKPDDPAQSKRFLELAKETGADADDWAALEASVKMLGKRFPEPRRKVGKKAKPRSRLMNARSGPSTFRTGFVSRNLAVPTVAPCREEDGRPTRVRHQR
jgi:hypothetical protein